MRNNEEGPHTHAHGHTCTLSNWNAKAEHVCSLKQTHLLTHIDRTCRMSYMSSLSSAASGAWNRTKSEEGDCVLAASQSCTHCWSAHSSVTRLLARLQESAELVIQTISVWNLSYLSVSVRQDLYVLENRCHLSNAKGVSNRSLHPKAAMISLPPGRQLLQLCTGGVFRAWRAASPAVKLIKWWRA